MNKSGTIGINIPEGGGAINGIGEKFSADLFTGTGNFSVPITLPPGRNGFQPQLSLVYSTGNGNSPFGLGWQLSVPGVERKTSSGTPLYLDGDFENQDTFLLSGAEDLIPVARGDNFVQYRPRTEGLFALIYRIRDTQNDYWEVKSKDGLTSIYGTPNRKDSDPAVLRNPEDTNQIFSWKLTRTVDPFGNRIEYGYRRDEYIRIDGAQNGRLDFQTRSQLYLQSVQYLNFDDAGAERFLASVQFDYEPERPDSFSVFTSGFHIRTCWRCSRINVYTHPFSDALSSENLVRSYQLNYTNDERTQISFLNEVAVAGHHQGHSEQLPPLTFNYSTFHPEERDFYPVEGQLPTSSLGMPDVETVDLFGNGLPDIVQMNGVVRYWRNLGNGSFDLPRIMNNAPGGFSLADPNVQFLDANGEGKADLYIKAPIAGYYPINFFEAEWGAASFRMQGSAPLFSFADPNVRLVDLDGNGITDALRTGDRFEFYYNDPDEGWNELRMANRETNLEYFPDVYFSDSRVKLGDMTGDGLQDIVLIHSGNVEYWPYMGNRKWGRRVHMQGSPSFPFGYNPSQILLGDINGNGLSDVVFVDNGSITIWLNQNGNSFSDPIEINGTPPVTDIDAVRLIDLNGTGVSGILWTSNQGFSLADHYFFLDLTGSVKPYVLNEMDNHMGSLTRVRYRSSTEYYREHEADPRTRWKTQLPFPVQVVAQVEVIDSISRGKLTTEYTYYNGYWDGAEREFRGFGKVEQKDTETGLDYNADGLHEPDSFDPIDEQIFAPPLLTGTWFHQGPIGPGHGDWRGENYNEFYVNEFWEGDEQLLTEFNELHIDDGLISPHDRRRRRDAIRALRGRVLRTEVYACDVEGNCGERPYTVTESQYGVRREFTPPDESEFDSSDNPVILPLKDNSGCVFFPYTVAQRTTQWEQGNDPMTQLSFVGDYDDFGQARQQTAIACPRTWCNLDDTFDGRQPFLATYGQTIFADSNEALRLPSSFEIVDGEFFGVAGQVFIKDRAAKTTSYEVAHPLALDWSIRDVLNAITSLDSLKIISQTINYYDGDVGEGFRGLQFGRIGQYGAVVRSESLVLTDEILRLAYRAEDTPLDIPNYLDPDNPVWPAEYPTEVQNFINSLPDFAGYIRPSSTEHADGYFVQTARVEYDFHLPIGTAGNPTRVWGLPLTNRDPLGRDTHIEYDSFALFPQTVTTPLGLQTSAEYDYHFMQPVVITDPNGNNQHFTFTPLGLVNSIYAVGQNGEGGSEAVPDTRFEYNFLAFENDGLPISVKTIQREYHVNDDEYVPAGHENDTIITVEYSDGFGRLIQTRTQAEDVLFGDERFGKGLMPEEVGVAIPPSVGRERDRSPIPEEDERLMNVVVSGWQVYDNKGQVILKYEPFFSKGFDYEEQEEVHHGKAVRMFYDPRGQVIRTVNPDGSEQRVIYGIPGNSFVPESISFIYEVPEYDATTNTISFRDKTVTYQVGRPSSLNDPEIFVPTPWEAYTYDANDLAPISFDELGSSLTDRAPTGHHFTPSSILIDGLGRTVLATERNRLHDAAVDSDISQYQTHSDYDIRGNLLIVRDALGRIAFRYEYDLANQNLRTDSIDAGLKRTILDAMGNPLESRDSKGALILSVYDDLNRPTSVWARDGHDGMMALRQHLVYAESPEANLTPLEIGENYLQGQLVRHYDEAGILTFHRYDFKGNLLDKTRQVVSDDVFQRLFTGGVTCDIAPHIVDWSQGGNIDAYAAEILEDTPFQTTLYFDALNRSKRMVYPEDVTRNRRALVPSYNRAGALESVHLFPDEASGSGEPYVERIAYNAKGQRTLIAYGNNMMTRYAYDENTFRLKRLRTERFNSTDDLSYESGNSIRQDFTYAYDLVGNITDIRHFAMESGVPGSLLGANRLHRSFQYDAIYRLTRADGGREHSMGHPTNPFIEEYHDDPNLTRLYWEHYEYDAMGNMLRLHHNPNTGTGGYNRTYLHETINNRLLSMTIGNGAVSAFVYHYDNAGNMLSEANRRFRWNHSNQLIAFCNPPNTTSPATIYAQYLYDDAGQRTKKIVRTQGGHYQVTIYIDGVFELHREIEGMVVARENNSLHIMDDQQRIAIVRVGDAFPDDDKPAIQYHLGDHLGSSNLVLDGHGGWVNTEEFTPYGETSFGSFAEKQYRFSGMIKDNESLLVYCSARYYSPWQGKWISTDSRKNSTENLFQYSYCNPVKFSDPNGLIPENSKIGAIGELSMMGFLEGNEDSYRVFMDNSKHVNSNGFDFIVYDKGTGRVWVVDNKSWSGSIGRVSAFEGDTYNKNISDAISYIEKESGMDYSFEARQAILDGQVDKVVSNEYAGKSSRFSKKLFAQGYKVFDVRTQKLYLDYSSWQKDIKAYTKKIKSTNTGKSSSGGLGKRVRALGRGLNTVLGVFSILGTINEIQQAYKEDVLKQIDIEGKNPEDFNVGDTFNHERVLFNIPFGIHREGFKIRVDLVEGKKVFHITETVGDSDFNPNTPIFGSA